MSGRLTLGIETVTKIGSLAVAEDNKILGRTIIDTKLRHNAKLISSLDELLGSLKIKISDIGAIAVDIGPGSFTGIRVGLASAIGLAQPNGKQLVGVCSLEVLCCQLMEKRKTGILVPVIDAKRGMQYSAWYKIDNGKIKTVKEPYLTTMDMIQNEKLPNSLFFGPDIDNTYPDAGIVALIGAGKIKEGFSQKNVAPMYIHDIEYRSEA